MSAKLPYFKMYPADADTDENYRILNDAELGFFTRCLNQSWVNGGLPVDPEDRARSLKTPRKIADQMWQRVGKMFVLSEDGSRYFNTRQEAEREDARTKSERATKSVRKRYERTYERNTDVLPPVSESVYDSGSNSGKQKKWKDLATASDDDFALLESTWELWRRQRAGQARDVVFRLILGSDSFDWLKFRERAPRMVSHYDAMSPPWRYASLSLWDWIEGGMILPPESPNGHDPMEGI